MPANHKHLSNSGQRILKITAGIIGGYFVTIFFHNALGSILEKKGTLIITTAYTSFFLWALLLVFAFMSKNGWKVWGIYILLSLIFVAIIILNK